MIVPFPQLPSQAGVALPAGATGGQRCSAATRQRGGEKPGRTGEKPVQRAGRPAARGASRLVMLRVSDPSTPGDGTARAVIGRWVKQGRGATPGEEMVKARGKSSEPRMPTTQDKGGGPGAECPSQRAWEAEEEDGNVTKCAQPPSRSRQGTRTRPTFLCIHHLRSPSHTTQSDSKVGKTVAKNFPEVTQPKYAGPRS